MKRETPQERHTAECDKLFQNRLPPRQGLEGRQQARAGPRPEAEAGVPQSLTHGTRPGALLRQLVPLTHNPDILCVGV